MFYLLVLLVGSLVPHLQFSFVCGNACRKASDLRLCEEFVLESEVGFILPYFTYPPHSSTKFMDFALLFPLCNSIATGFLHFSFITFLCFPNARSTKACPSECPFAAELADPTKCRGENVGGLIVMHHSLSLSVSLSSLVGQHSVKAHSVPLLCSSIS